MRATLECLERNLRKLYSFLAPWPGWRVGEENGLLWCESPIAHEAFNKVLECQVSGSDAAERIAKLKDRAAARHVPFGFWVGPTSRPKNLEEILATLGFHRQALAWAMARPLDDAPLPPQPANVSVQVLEGPELWPQWLEIFTQVFQLPPVLAQAYGQQLACGGFGYGVPLRHYLAFYRGRPAGIASIFQDDSALGIYNFGTVPSLRGRGVGTYLLATLLEAGRAQGLKLAVLRGTTEAYGFYLRQAFRHLARYELFRFAPSVTVL
ncbi:MAG: GNAT family N-acetyltransferase [Thermoanaerobaculum sp.]